MVSFRRFPDFCFIVIVMVSTIMPCISTQLYAQSISSTKVKTNPVIVIDPGHGGKDSGCNGHAYNEKHIALSLSKDIAKQLRQINPNVDIIFTRTEDNFLTLSQRAAIANCQKADMFVSVHANSIAIDNVRGSETFVYGPHLSNDHLSAHHNSEQYGIIESGIDATHSDCDHTDSSGPESWILAATLKSDNLKKSIEIATSVEAKLSQLPGHKSRGVKQANFAVLKNINIPSILIEAGYLTNKHDFYTLTNKKGRMKIAKKIAEGINQYLQKNISNLPVSAPITYSNPSNAEINKDLRGTRPHPAKTNPILRDDEDGYVLVIATKKTQDFHINLDYNKVHRSRIIQNKNGQYMYAIGQYRNIEEAKQDRTKMIALGYKGAYVSTINRLLEGIDLK